MTSPLQGALTIAKKRATRSRWRDLWTIAPALADDELRVVDAALEAWPDAMRAVGLEEVLSTEGAVGGSPHPGLLLARQLDAIGVPVDLALLRDLLAHPCARRLRILRLFNNGGLHGLEACFRAPETAPALVWLEVGGHNLDDDALAAFVAEARLPMLRHLSLERSGLTGRGAKALAGAATLSALRSLVLFENALADAGAAALATGRSLGALTALNLGWNDIGPEGARAVSEATGLQHLERLDLMLNPLGDAGVMALLACPGLPSLRALNLAEAKLSPQGAAQLGGSPLLCRVEELILANNHGIGPAVVEALAGPSGAPKLGTLDLSGTAIEFAHLQALGRAKIPALRALSLRDCDLGDSAARWLSVSNLLPRLAHLDLRRNCFGIAATRELVLAADAAGLTLLYDLLDEG